MHNKWAGLGFVLKTICFIDSESTLLFERQSLYTGCTLKCKTFCFNLLTPVSDASNAQHGSLFSKLHNRDTLHILNKLSNTFFNSSHNY